MKAVPGVLGVLCVAVACASIAAFAPPGPPAGSAPASRATEGPIAPPRPGDPTPLDLPGLHNLVAFGGEKGPVVLSGSVPEGDAGFESLARLGIRTIVSVDGALPDLDRARARGMRYVHLPIGYDGFDDARRAQLVRAVRDLPKPVYIHCHHGMHRSAGAAAVIGVSLGWLTNAEAEGRMKVARTAEGYKGLWACAAKAAPMAAAAIDAASGDFPESTRPGTMVEAMVAIDDALERLKLAERSGWKAPPDHPDLAPAADAGKLVDLLRLLDGDAHVEALEVPARADFRALLEANARQASALEEMLAGKSTDAARLGPAMKALAAGCKECHVRHRD